MLRIRVRPFRFKNFSLISEIKRIWIRFTCVSLFHYKISLLFFSLLFASFRFKFFASLHFSNLKKERKKEFLFILFTLLTLDNMTAACTKFTHLE
jgi:hypothetical protein